jgi:hypothetical protein
LLTNCFYYLFQKVDLEFGFDLNPELLQQSSSSSIYEQQGSAQQPPAMSAQQMPPARSPINIVDAAIVSFGEAGGPMMIPVAPFGMFPANGGGMMPPPFTSSSPYLPFPIMHQVRTKIWLFYLTALKIQYIGIPEWNSGHLDAGHVRIILD